MVSQYLHEIAEPVLRTKLKKDVASAVCDLCLNEYCDEERRPVQICPRLGQEFKGRVICEHCAGHFADEFRVTHLSKQIRLTTCALSLIDLRI